MCDIKSKGSCAARLYSILLSIYLSISMVVLVGLPAVVELDGSLLRLLGVGLDVVQVLDAEVTRGGAFHLLPPKR